MPDQRIAIAPSVRLAVALSGAHIAAAGLLWFIPLPGLGRAVFTLAIAISFIYLMARDASLHAPHSIVALEIRDGAGISLQTRRGEWLDGDLLGSSYVSPWLTIVNCQLRGRRGARRVILLPDNVDPRDFRRLRTWLRWKGRESLDTAGP
jgi:toxin CptA